jgi:hypothetical protein
VSTLPAPNWRCITTSVPRNTIPTASCTMDGQTARRSRPVSNWRRRFDQVPGLQTIQGRSLLIRYNERLCVHDPVPWTRTSHRLIRRQGRSFGPTPTLLALQDSKDIMPSYRRPSFEGRILAPYGRRFSLTTTTP